MPALGECRPLAERFWEKVTRAAPDQCWMWAASKNAKGYGTIGVDYSSRLAHRVAWELETGPIPDGAVICHHCDTPGCVNPAHLFLGTQADNVADMRAKGRNNGPRGERCHTAKLNENDVREIRASTLKNAELARRHGVTGSMIAAIRHRKSWKHVA